MQQTIAPHLLAGGVALVLCMGVHAEVSAQSSDSAPQLADAQRGHEFSGELADYTQFALRHHPELVRQHAEWQSERAAVSASGRWPEPMVNFGWLVVPIETRVGPQRFRIGASQMVPWPGERAARESVFEARASSRHREYDARMTQVRREVAELYWRRWQVARARHWQSEQLELLRTIESTVRARVETGAQPASQLHQIAVEQTRVRDRIDGLDATSASLAAEFRRALGLGGDGELPVTPTAPPGPQRPASGLERIVEMAREHPEVLAARESLRSAQRQVEQYRLENSPSFQVGASYMVTGEARMPGVEESGKDPISVSVGVNLPVWLGANRSKVESAKRKTEARRAALRETKQRMEASARAAMATLRETAKRIELHRETLIPQAETAVDSVLGQYESGSAEFSSVLTAQRRLLEIRLKLSAARARHARAWARLESLTGQPLEREEWTHE